MHQFIVNGGKPLHGEVFMSGSKNAALPILAATLLTDEACVLKNVPDIEDIHTMISLLRSLGSEVEFKSHTVKIRTKHLDEYLDERGLGLAGPKPSEQRKGARVSSIARPSVSGGNVVSPTKMRASVLLLGPLLARTGAAHLPYPGGCVLGARPIDTHLNIFRQFGVRDLSRRKDEILLEGRPKKGEVVLPEFSVTATENAIMAATLSSGVTQIRLAAIEPHVQDLCRFLQKMGLKIDGIGSHTLKISGKQKLSGAAYSITPDYLEAGTFVLAAAVTRGNVLIKNIVPNDLDAMWNLLREMGIRFEFKKNAVHIRPSPQIRACIRLQTNVFPGFPTDLQPPFAVLLTQAKGKSFIHETLFEGRFSYFLELAKMGAKINKINPHEAVIEGPSKLRASRVKSFDIRAGAAMILAALAAKGKSVVSDIQYIDRGYERFDEKLRSLGADITRS